MIKNHWIIKRDAMNYFHMNGVILIVLILSYLKTNS